jgi:hypothetical protein
MKSQYAHEGILVLGAAGHRLDEINVRVLSTLTAGIIRVAPHDNLTDLVQDTVRFIKVPASLLTTLVREVALQQFQEFHSHLLQPRYVIVSQSTFTAANIPLHALDEDLHDLVTGVRDVC